MCSFLMCCCTHSDFLKNQSPGFRRRAVCYAAPSRNHFVPLSREPDTRLFSTDIRRSDASSDPDSRALVVFCNTDESGGNVTSRAPHSIVFLSITCPPGSAPCIMDWGVKPRAEGISTVYSHARLLFQSFFESRTKGLW